jgi:PIN domain nuclease of toxin-antitoxin system
MKLLLDTHIWLWGLLEPERLTSTVSSALLAAANTLYLSPISVWETMLLLERGRIRIEGDRRSWIERTLRESPVREAPLTHEVTIVSRFMDLPHQDPADRFIAASASVHGLTLVTADERLLESKEYETIANR